MTLPALATDRSIQGLGVGDWPGYADVLSTKMAYSNTFFERQPHLDIHAVDQSLDNRFDFVIASDVLEHVAPPVSAALSNLNKILKPGGFLLLTVPYQRDGQTVEHFPALHDYKIEDREGEKVLVNLTADGSRQEYRDLVFHGGYGETLELRLFSAPGLKEELARAGFDEVKVRDCPNFEFGIYWGDGLSYPVVARKGAKGSQYGSAL